MPPTLNDLLDRGRQYVATCERLLRDERMSVEERQRRLCLAFRAHSTSMQDIDLGDAQALLACVIGAVKWAERHSNSGYLSDALNPLEDAESLLRAHFLDEDEPELALNVPHVSPRRLPEYA